MKLYVLIIAIILSIGTARTQNIDSLLMQREDTTQFIRSDSLVLQFLEYSNIPITDNNKVKLIKSGREKFEDLFEAIRGAKHHIHLEYFNFRNDSIANALFDLLGEKVKEGVKVRAMFDAFGNWSNNKPLKKRHLKAIREKGIEIVKFDPFKFPYINHAAHRDHRKIAVIDGKIGYTGGMNIADYYINGLPKIGTWRDMHIRIEGDAVNILQEIFLDIWNKTTKQNIVGEEYFPNHPKRADSCNTVISIVDRTPKRNSRIFCTDFIHPQGTQKGFEPGDESGNYDFFQIRHPFHTGCFALCRTETDEKRGNDLFVQRRISSLENHDGGRPVLYRGYSQPEQPQPAI